MANSEKFQNHDSIISSTGDKINQIKDKFYQLGTLSSDSVKIIFENFLLRYYDKVCEYDPNKPSKMESPRINRILAEIVKDSTEEIKQDYLTICQKYLKTRRSVTQELEGNNQIVKDSAANNSLAQNIAHTRLISDAFVEFYEGRNVFGRCKRSFINEISLNNRYEWVDRDKLYDKVLPYLHVVIVLVMLGSIIGFEYWHENYCSSLQAGSMTVGDYTLRFYGLPHGDNLEGYPLRDNLQNALRYGQHRHVVTDINFVYDIEEYLGKKEELNKEIVSDYRKDLQKVLEDIEGDEKELQTLNKEGKNNESHPLLNETSKNQTEMASFRTKALVKEIEEWEEKYEKDDIKMMTGHAYVSFKTIEIRNLFLEKFRKKGFFYDNFRVFPSREVDLSLPVNNSEWMVYCKKPTEPNDIIWENLKYGRVNRFFRRLSADILSFIVLCIGFFVLYYMKTDKVIF